MALVPPKTEFPIPPPGEIQQADPPAIPPPPTVPDLPPNVDPAIGELFPEIAETLKQKTEELDQLKAALTITEIEHAAGIAAVGSISDAVTAYLESDNMTQGFTSLTASSMTGHLLGNQPEMGGVDVDLNPSVALAPKTVKLNAITALELATEPTKVGDVITEISGTDPRDQAEVASAKINAAVGTYASRAMITNNLSTAEKLNPNFKKFGAKTAPSIPFPEKAGVGTGTVPKTPIPTP